MNDIGTFRYCFVAVVFAVSDPFLNLLLTLFSLRNEVNE